MTQYLNQSFTVNMSGTQEYRDNWDAIFGEPEQKEVPPPSSVDDDDFLTSLFSLENYQGFAARTIDHNLPDRDLILNCCLGLAGETGEVLELIKKHYFHGRPLTREIKLELGDVLWYLAGLCTALGLNLSDVAEANIEKLYKRYPEGFKCKPTSTSPNTELSEPSPEKSEPAQSSP